MPNVARMYDYYLGGKDNFQADRVAAAVKVYDQANAHLCPRSEEELEAMFAGFELLDLPAVLPDLSQDPNSPRLGWACIARKP